METGTAVRGGGIVVVVEDDPILRVEATMLLEEAGFAVAEFHTADQALAYVNGHVADIAMVFTDFMLPGCLDGLSLARTACMLWPWISVVITSSELDPDTETLPEAAIFLSKPWLPADLIGLANVAVGQRSARPS